MAKSNILRTFNPWVSGKAGLPLKVPRWSGEHWAAFEALLIPALKTHGELVVQPENVQAGDSSDSVDVAAYAHRTRRDLVQKTAYSYPKFAEARVRLFYMLMHVPGWFHLDTEGWGADNSTNRLAFDPSTIDAAEAISFVAKLRERLLGSNISKFTQPARKKAPGQDYILHCLQLPNDYTIKHHSPIAVGDLITRLSSWAKRLRVPLVLKPHPVGTSDDIRAVLNSSVGHGVTIFEGNIHDALEGARAVYVINSGTGMEALIHGKPVVTFGDCDYRRATFAASVKDLDAPFRWAIDAKPQDKFLLWYYRNFIFDTGDPTCQDRIAEYLKRTI